MPRRPHTPSSEFHAELHAELPTEPPGDARASGCPAMRPAALKVAGKVTTKKPRARRERSPLEVIPGVGPAAAEDFNRLGFFEVTQLKGQNPQQLYDDICALDGMKHDRCVLYVFRCAVYYASRRKHDPEKLKWWNWKD